MQIEQPINPLNQLASKGGYMPHKQSSLTRYDEMIVIATNKPHLLQVVRWGTEKSCWRFLLTLNGDEPFETGDK